MGEKRTTIREIFQGHVRDLGAGVEIQPLQFRAAAAEGRAGGVRDLLALAQVQLLDVRAGLGQRAHRVVPDALASPKRQLSQEPAASSRYILYN